MATARVGPHEPLLLGEYQMKKAGLVWTRRQSSLSVPVYTKGQARRRSPSRPSEEKQDGQFKRMANQGNDDNFQITSGETFKLIPSPAASIILHCITDKRCF
ncbi:hypothetical protein DPMN_010723 [Dreissena polymorpha]|uniref:Uncharacterized protein n=1 Tax=Dreissena polymorpha TaxID=45954 RepID=A0A9D4S174_DREPO|nr:hypothetical protein DPMN_010723 [Dreissena polymorpha]